MKAGKCKALLIVYSKLIVAGCSPAIPFTCEAEIRRITVQGQPSPLQKKKKSMTLSQKQVRCFTSVMPNMSEKREKDHGVRLAPGKSEALPEK
jgi:hypothetical protein